MSDRPDPDHGGLAATLSGERRSAAAAFAEKLREEHARAEAAARMETDDPASGPSPQDTATITSFGAPIPFAPGEVRETPTTHLSPDAHAPSEPEEQPFRPSVEWFEELLWKDASDDVRVYCIMDGYWAKGLYGRLLASPDISWAHMFQGDVALNIIQDAPFIIALKRGHKILRWLIEEGWGDGWGMYLTASTKAALERYGKTTRLPPDMAPSNEERVKLCNLTEGMEDPLWLMRRHFRRFSDVELEDDGRVVDFRYYDPATLRTYLPSCNNYELRRFVGPVRHFYAEGYREAESLNQPHQIYRFAAWSDKKVPLDRQLDRSGPAMVFEGYCYDARKKETHSIPRNPVSEGKPERKQSLYPMIRSEQRVRFRQVQEYLFLKKMILKLQKLNKIVKNQQITNDVSKFSKRHISLARALNLKSEKEILAFSTCALLFGEGFQTKFPPAVRLFDKWKQQPAINMEIQLTELAKKAVLSRGASNR